ncbi:MAG: hypothetical protein D6737_06095 [Chloroflexi bacterium]|nr:MAG: hypothetical protein D6737_06095 [Chloroflexota bacterium]
MPKRPHNEGNPNKFGLMVGTFMNAIKSVLRVGNASSHEMISFADEFSDLSVNLQLEVGDELLIIEEIAQIYTNLSNAVGRIVIIDQISNHKDQAIRASAFGIQVAVSVNLARQMRAAFLRQEQAFS